MSEAPSPVTISKDLEGVYETSSTKPEAQAQSGMPASGAVAGAAGAGQVNKRQRKIAVLTSGGDSAGMNAAGT